LLSGNDALYSPITAPQITGTAVGCVDTFRFPKATTENQKSKAV